MTEALSDRGKGYLLIGLTAVLFSTTEIALKALGDSFAPIQLTMERQLVGAAALGFLLFLRGDLRRIDLHGRNCLMILLFSFIVGVVHMSLIQLALLTEDASAVAAILSGSPVFSFLFAHYILKEPLRLHHFLALAFQVAGILAILNPFSLEMSLRGFLLVLFGTLSFSLYGTLAKKNLSRFSSGQLAFLTLLFSSLELLLILLAGRTGRHFRTDDGLFPGTGKKGCHNDNPRNDSFQHDCVFYWIRGCSCSVRESSPARLSFGRRTAGCPRGWLWNRSY